ncbi:MAG: T9SS type A sorting domain-containing protein, partial [Bacteroidetes bacterium]|nr:T9SS type A sorting domain-containing protein [Bacteroidota bacterium]
NTDVTNGTDTFAVRVDSDVDISGMAAPLGTFNITGLGGQFDSSSPYSEGYQLLPRYVADIDPYNTVVITLPEYDIIQVIGENEEGVADSLNIRCQLQGIVYGVNMRGNDGGVQFTVIDETGGIGVYGEGIDNYEVTEGDEIILQGTIGQYSGLTQINADSISIVSTDNTLVDPTVVTALGEDTESQLIMIQDVSFVDVIQWDPSGSGMTINVTDGTNTFAMRIDKDVDLFQLATAPEYAVFNVTGIGGQFKFSAPFVGGYQILPRYISDLEEVVGTNDRFANDLFTFYPNPVNDRLFIHSEKQMDKVIITNALGQQFLQLTDQIGSFSIDVNQLPKGVYLLTILKDDKLQSRQFVKQ